jgi:hypothetical protein
MAYNTHDYKVSGHSQSSGILPFFCSFAFFKIMDDGERVQKPSNPDAELCHFLLLHSMHQQKDLQLIKLMPAVV